jgi:hypothetical protein
VLHTLFISYVTTWMANKREEQEAHLLWECFLIMVLTVSLPF